MITSEEDKRLVEDIRSALLDALSECQDHFTRKRIREAMDGCDELLGD